MKLKISLILMISIFCQSSFAVISRTEAGDLYNICKKNYQFKQQKSKSQVNNICKCVARNHRYLLEPEDVRWVKLSWTNQLNEEQRKSDTVSWLMELDYRVFEPCTANPLYMSEKAAKEKLRIEKESAVIEGK